MDFRLPIGAVCKTWIGTGRKITSVPVTSQAHVLRSEKTMVVSNALAVLNHLVADTVQLFTLPAVAVEVLKLTSDPRADTRAIKTCIEKDPALTCKILRIVDSSLFGLSGQVSDLNQALALLGSKPLKLLVLGFSLPAGLFDGLPNEILAWYWRRTLTKAVAAREIGQSLGRVGDEAFIAGLLQDLGMLLLIQKIPAYSGFLKQVRSQRGKLLALEEESMGFNHTAVTGELLKRWMLPEMIVDAVTVHGDDTSVGVPALAGDGTKSEKGKPPKGGTPTDRKITQSAAACTTRPRTKPGSANKVRESVELAELISRLLVDEDCRSLEELERTGQRDHRFSTDRLQALVAVIEEKVRQLADVLALRLDDGQDYCDVLARAHAQLSEAAAEAVTQILDGRESERFTQVDNELLAGQVQSLAAEMTRLSPGWWKSPPPPRRACEEIGTGSTAPCVEPRESRQREAPSPFFTSSPRRGLRQTPGSSHAAGRDRPGRQCRSRSAGGFGRRRQRLPPIPLCALPAAIAEFVQEYTRSTAGRTKVLPGAIGPRVCLPGS